MGAPHEWAGFAAGVALGLATGSSVVRVLVVPRGLPSRIGVSVQRVVRRALLLIAGRFESYSAKDHALAFQGPLILVGQLLVWLLSMFLAFSLMLWPLVDGTFGTAVREAGSSMFTLGYAATSGTGVAAVHFLAAASGLVVVALQIAYLPTLYAAFNRRENLVTVLESRAGTPAWGPEILARHQQVGTVDNLPAFYAEWERWTADVVETHTNYPVLIDFRSPAPERSWVLALLAVLDSAALFTAVAPSTAPSEARLCLRMGFVGLREIARVLGIPYDPDPYPDDPVAIAEEEFRDGIARLEASGFPMERSAEEAWPHFRGWRVNYESIAYALADRLVLARALWSGPRTHLGGLAVPPRTPEDRQPGGQRSPS